MSEDRKKFIEYITGLATDNVGETALVVAAEAAARQRRQPDISRRRRARRRRSCAFLPEKTRMKEGEAWYVNTGSFIADCFRRQACRQASNVEYVLFMMLDDVGNEVKRTAA